MKKKFLLILTTLIFLSSIIFTAHASTSKNEFNVDDITKYKELNNLKTKYANAYDIGNDQIVYQISTKKIHYKDKAGIWNGAMSIF